MNFFIPKKWILSVLMFSVFFIGSGYSEYTPIDTTNHYYTSKITLTSNDIRSNLVESANKYLGSDYLYGSNGSKYFDCSGLTYFLFSNVDISIGRNSIEQSKNGKRVPINSANPGDLIFFAVKGNVHHVGLIVKIESNKLWMIHSVNNRGVVLEEVFSSKYWASRIYFVKDVVSMVSSLDTSDIIF
jgi:cell wall-associated NlpC family hydrolase